MRFTRPLASLLLLLPIAGCECGTPSRPPRDAGVDAPSASDGGADAVSIEGDTNAADADALMSPSEYEASL